MSLQNSKRAANAISITKQMKSVIDHQKNMLGKGFTPLPESKWMQDRVLDKIEILNKIYFKKGRECAIENEIPVWRTPSYGACYETSGLRGGSSAYFNKFTKECEADYFLEKEMPISDFLRFDKEWTGETLDCYKNLSMRAYHYGDLTYNETIPIFSFGFDIGNIRSHLNNEILRRSFDNTPTKCKYSMILEPFKVRGVTMGEGDVYQMGRLLQPVLHSHLRDEKDCFRFIGKRHNVDDINDVYSGVKLHTLEYFYEQVLLCYSSDLQGYSNELEYLYDLRTFIVAGDFKNATDCMCQAIPQKFISSLKDNKILSDLWIRVCQLTLGGHEIDYSNLEILDKIDHPEFKEIILQENGQLMGSPLSFIVLCLLNAAMLWVSAELYEKKEIRWNNIKYKYRCLFNGDDTSFTSNPFHYDIWAKVCSSCGLELSAGKNYCSSEFVNINSTNYFGKKEIIDQNSFILTDFSELFVVNPGLIKGQSKVLGGNNIDVSSLGSTCDQLEECIRVADAIQKTRCYEVFEHHMRPKLLLSKRPWTLPRLFGGLGLPFGEKPSAAQYLLALDQFANYVDLTDDSISKSNDKMSNQYFNQICQNYEIEVIKPSIVRNDDKTNDESTLYQTPTLTTSFLSSPYRERVIRIAKSILYPKDRKRKKDFNLYRAIFKERNPAKREILKKKLRKYIKESEKGFTEIEEKRYQHKIVSERTYCKKLQKYQKLVGDLNASNFVINVPDDYLNTFINQKILKGGLQSEIITNISKSLRIYN
jgi:hypothetical protein